MKLTAAEIGTLNYTLQFDGEKPRSYSLADTALLVPVMQAVQASITGEGSSAAFSDGEVALDTAAKAKVLELMQSTKYGLSDGAAVLGLKAKLEA
jgi:hypothetical protein